MPRELNPVWHEKFYLWVLINPLDIAFIVKKKKENYTLKFVILILKNRSIPKSNIIFILKRKIVFSPKLLLFLFKIRINEMYEKIILNYIYI